MEIMLNVIFFIIAEFINIRDVKIIKMVFIMYKLRISDLKLTISKYDDVIAINCPKRKSKTIVSVDNVI